MVIDTSALLALFFKEPHGQWVKEQLEEHSSNLIMSAVNQAELWIHLKGRQPSLVEEFRKRLNEDSLIRIIPVTAEQAEKVADVKLKYRSLNFGDCFAYALAKENDMPILTLDSDFKKTDIKVIMPR